MELLSDDPVGSLFLADEPRRNELDVHVADASIQDVVAEAEFRTQQRCRSG